MNLLWMFILVSHIKCAIIGEWDDEYRDSYEPNKGILCSDHDVEPSLKWFVDVYREKVYPFWYLGCGNNENMYNTMLAAERALPTDSAQCEGFNMTGWPTYGSSSDETDYKCPEGSTYLPYGEYSAICCDKKTAERYRESKNSKCPGGEPLFEIEVVHMDNEMEVESFRENRTLFGKSCHHNFCPNRYICIQGEFEAFCCAESDDASTTTTRKTTNMPRKSNINESMGFVEWFRKQLVESSLLFRFIFVTLAIFLFVVSLLVCVTCRTSRVRRPLFHPKYTDAKETMTLNP